MTFNDQIQKVYYSFYRRIKRYLIPALLLLTFLSARQAMGTSGSQIFNRLELLNIHYVAGLLLLLSLIVLLYHRYYIGFEPGGAIQSRPLRKLVNRAFFTLLSLLAISGGVTYLASLDFSSWLPHRDQLLFLHHSLLWAIAPVLLVKVYLDSSAWASQLYWSLKEH